MSRKTRSLRRFFLFNLLFSFIPFLLISGCRQNDENATTSPAPAYIVPITDNNNDGSPDGWSLYSTQANFGDYELIMDTTIGHTDESSLLIQTDKNIEEGGFGSAGRELSNINQYKGNRVQLSGYIKTENVSDLALLWFRVDGVGRGNILAFDNMADRGPTGTTDWQRFELVLDIPDDVAIRSIPYGFLLVGSGKAWADDIQFDIVGKDVPVTDMAPSMQAASEALETAVTQQTIFNELWQTVNDTYVSTDFNGVDWPTIKETYQSQIQDTAPDEAFYTLMAEMISELKDDHSIFLSPEEATQEDLLYSGEKAFDGVGMLVYTVPEAEALMVAFTFPDSGAEEAGIQSHDLILAADGRPTCCDETGAELPTEIPGPAGTTVTLTVQTPGAEPREIEVMRGPISGHAPVMSQVIDGRIGYLSIPTLEDLTIDEQVETAWQDLNANGSLEGLILDMRINSGGQREVLQPLLELFTNGAVGEFNSRENTWIFNIAGRDVANSQEIPLIILIGPQTNSYAEVFSGILQANGRATLIGQTSRGNVETTFSHDFADGSRAHIATETFIPADAPDANWEQTGIIPDIEIEQAWHEFATLDDDQALKAAIEQLE